MKIKTNLFKLTAAASLMAVAGGVHAQTETNTMTNIVTVTDACDIVATGVDFGMTILPIPSVGIPSVLANTALGNAVTGNAGVNPAAGRDGGVDDTFELLTPVSAINTVINTAIGSVNVGVPGVYVVCTTAPAAITLRSGASLLVLPTTVTAFTGTFNSKMTGIGGGAGAGNSISYTLSVVGTPVSTAVTGLPVNVFVAAFAAVGLIPGAQGSNSVVPGYYSDTATAQVDF